MQSSVSYMVSLLLAVVNMWTLLQTVSLTGAHVLEDPAHPGTQPEGCMDGDGLNHLQFKVSIKCLMTHML